jgi:hypothetical protein
MIRKAVLITVCAIVLLTIASMAVAQSHESFIGRWALDIPYDPLQPWGGAGWLSIEDNGGGLEGTLLWRTGGISQLTSVAVDDEILTIARGRSGTDTISATVSRDTMKLTRTIPAKDGRESTQQQFTGRRLAPIPPRPDLSKARRGKAVTLFNGVNLDGWKIIGANGRIPQNDSPNAWSVNDGILENNPVQPEGKHIYFANLCTVDEFKDFNISLEVYIAEGNNSGVYLRGLYEVQIGDTYGKEASSGSMGAVYGRITPIRTGEKPNQWHTYDITLLDRHVTVIINGKTFIDNQPLVGCTGGAISSDEYNPGPIYLQGDHTEIKYRNIVLTPLTN